MFFAKHVSFFYIIFFIFFLYHFPVLWLGERAFYNAFDTLDSYIVWYRVVMNSGNAWSDAWTMIQEFMGGVPKFTLANPFDYYYQLNLLFPTFVALNVSMISASLAAWGGMWLLSRRYLGLAPLQAAFLSLSFAFTPFLPAWVMSIAGQPLLLYAILNIRGSQSRWWNWIIVFLFPLFSNFQSAGVFILAGIAGLVIYDYRERRPVLKLMLVFAGLLTIYSFTKINLVSNLLAGQGFVSHRTEMERYALPPWICFKVFVRYFLYGNMDVALSLHTFAILPFVLVTFFYRLVVDGRPDKRLTVLLLVIICICAGVASLQLEPVVWLRNKSSFLRMYSMERFHIFLQLLWHLAAARALLIISESVRKQLTVFLFAVQMLVCFAYQPSYYAYLVKPYFTLEPYHYIYRYRDYYAVDLFESVKRRIGLPLPDYRVISIGLPPAVAQYNGMWTADGYVSNYSLDYKHAFRKIISEELDKNNINKGFFDGWGSQCIVLYDQEIGNFNTHVTKDQVVPDRDIRLNAKAMKDLGCGFVLSAEKIRYPEKSGLRRIAHFRSALWNLILYEIV